VGQVKWISLSPRIDVKVTKDGHVIRTARIADILIPNDVLEKLKEQEWQLDSSESKRK